MADYVNELRSPNRKDIEAVYTNLKTCASYLVFNDYFTVDQLRLVKAHTCKKHLLCPFCAMRRAGKYVQKNTPKVEYALEQNPNLIPAILTLTVKNGESLPERFAHLKNAEKRLKQRARDAKKGKSVTEFSKVAGSIAAYEFTKNAETGWHPHIHMVVLLDSYIDQKKLSDEWREITGDSFIVDIRKITAHRAGGVDVASAMLEVCKYSLKFHDMTLSDTWHAYEVLNGRRLINSSGLLRGLSLPDNLLDDPLEGLPFLERHYRFNKNARAYELTKAVRSCDGLTGTPDTDQPAQRSVTSGGWGAAPMTNPPSRNLKPPI